MEILKVWTKKSKWICKKYNMNPLKVNTAQRVRCPGGDLRSLSASCWFYKVLISASSCSSDYFSLPFSILLVICLLCLPFILSSCVSLPWLDSAVSHYPPVSTSLITLCIYSPSVAASSVVSYWVSAL